MGTSDQSAEIRALSNRVAELEAKLADSEKTLLKWMSGYHWMRGRAEALNEQVNAARHSLGCQMPPSDLSTSFFDPA